jgi:mannose-6-phosphate isomerase-like protein (cupin superfamily)
MIVDKPWGYEHIWAKTDKYVGKLLHINEGERLSLQYHKIKEETIYVVEGVLELVLEEGSRRDMHSVFLQPGDTFHITPLTIHRFAATQGTHVKVMEVSTIELDDVVRIEDDYSRS